ncbi:hypothetical protein L1D40_04760 [Shewanella insulae]|uniref:hypothetical protein n=1 Tax=Shewanella insulae TaxID=2681496 RepID=UPI001EFC4436|nr:hypothetical protein [Shewanella insulae]MCG9754541.1 hypothetical protein [Shewanella insulae]
MPDMELLIEAVNNLGKPKLTDFATLGIALISLVISWVALRFTKNQRDISQRAERLEIHTELLDILHYLKHYNGSCDEASEEYFRRLLKLKAISKSAYSEEASTFINTVLTNMHDMPVRYSAYLKEVSEETAKALEAMGIDPNVHDALACQYFELKRFFQKTAFVEFERLFPV